jgi:hypothetical protein
MAQNLIKLTDEIKNEYAKAMPDGMDEKFLKKIPVLFRRIEELERALAPFGRAFLVNANFKDEMVTVYKKDCANALDMLDSGKGFEIPRLPVEYPAE